jgi:hypothetical protein
MYSEGTCPSTTLTEDSTSPNLVMNPDSYGGMAVSNHLSNGILHKLFLHVCFELFITS